MFIFTAFCFCLPCPLSSPQILPLGWKSCSESVCHGEHLKVPCFQADGLYAYTPHSCLPWSWSWFFCYQISKSKTLQLKYAKHRVNQEYYQQIPLSYCKLSRISIISFDESYFSLLNSMYFQKKKCSKDIKWDYYLKKSSWHLVPEQSFVICNLCSSSNKKDEENDSSDKQHYTAVGLLLVFLNSLFVVVLVSCSYWLKAFSVTYLLPERGVNASITHQRKRFLLHSFHGPVGLPQLHSLTQNLTKHCQSCCTHTHTKRVNNIKMIIRMMILHCTNVLCSQVSYLQQ